MDSAVPLTGLVIAGGGAFTEAWVA
jgi:hypothetical protein